MSDEEMIPIRKILMEAAKEVEAFISADMGESTPEVEQFLNYIEKGIRRGIEEQEKGLYALNAQQEKMLATFEKAKKEAKPGTKLQLVAVPEGAKVILGIPRENTSGLVDTDGAPLMDESRIIVSE